MKMLGWERPFGSAITAIRDREAVPAVRMSQIRGFNLSLQFVMAPVTAFVTFASYRALNGVRCCSSHCNSASASAAGCLCVINTVIHRCGCPLHLEIRPP